MRCIQIATLFLFSVVSYSVYSASVVGIIDGVYNGTRVSGWACLTGSTRSIPLEIYVGGPKGTGRRIATVMASYSNEAAVDRACQHSGSKGRHRFTYTFSTTQKKNYKGKPIYIHGNVNGTLTGMLHNSGRFVMPVGKGHIDGIESGKLKGWACIENVTRSVYVDIFAGGKRVKSVLASSPGVNVQDANAIATECKHTGKSGNHRFYASFTDKDKALYAGQRLSAHVRETESRLANSWRDSMPGDVIYQDVDNAFSNSKSDRVELSWDYANTAHCNEITGTLINFSGGAGVWQGEPAEYVKEVAAVLGQGCVRFVHANINPNSDQIYGGYWLKNGSYKEASGLMTNILKSASSTWRDAAGKHPIQGDIMVTGTSAGGMIAAAALEWNDDYHSLVDRTIFVSAPLGSNLSVECRLIQHDWLKQWIDDIFRYDVSHVGDSCASCTPINSCIVDATKNVIDVSDKGFRDYLAGFNSQYSEKHDMAILVGSADRTGCVNGNTADCGYWNAEEAARRYIRAITAGTPGVFHEGDLPGNTRGFTINVISGGGHDLWRSRQARKLICKNALEEVGYQYEVCDNEL